MTFDIQYKYVFMCSNKITMCDNTIEMLTPLSKLFPANSLSSE